MKFCESLVVTMRLFPASKMLGCAPVGALFVSMLAVFVTSVVTLLVTVLSTMTLMVTVCLFLVPTMTAVGVCFDLTTVMFVVVLVSFLVLTMMSGVVVLVEMSMRAMFSVTVGVGAAVPFSTGIVLGTSSILGLK